jgi:hypothetical protein
LFGAQRFALETDSCSAGHENTFLLKPAEHRPKRELLLETSAAILRQRPSDARVIEHLAHRASQRLGIGSDENVQTLSEWQSLNKLTRRDNRTATSQRLD